VNFIIDPSLVLYLPLYKLDGDSFMSQDAYGHLCTVTGASWRSNGRYFDGLDDYTRISHNPIFTFNSVFTVEWWGRIDSYTGNRSGIISKDRNDTNFWDFRPHHSTRINFLYGFTDSVYYDNLADIGDGFHHYVAVINGTDFSFYQDSEWKGNRTLSHTVGDNTQPIYIGVTLNRGDLTSYYLQGLIGEALIYNRVLTPVEIQHNYLATKWRYR